MMRHALLSSLLACVLFTIAPSLTASADTLTVIHVWAPYEPPDPRAVDLLANPGANILPWYFNNGPQDPRPTELAFDVQVIGLSPGSLTFQASLVVAGLTDPLEANRERLHIEHPTG